MQYRKLWIKAAAVLAMGVSVLATSKPAEAANPPNCVSYCDVFCGSCGFGCSRQCFESDCVDTDGGHWNNARICTPLY
jgi:hypothetical protein